MCGIAGILDSTAKRLPQKGELSAMQRTMRHRGPDGDGQWFSPEGNVGLAHLRLAIVDLSNQARQPMTDGLDKACVTYNGEIYNHYNLRRELEMAGRYFATDHSDTEVLVHGYLEWGIDGLLQRLDGMFSFAIWDEYEEKFSINTVISAEVIDIYDRGALVDLGNAVEGFVPKRYSEKEDGSYIVKGEKLDFKVIEFSKENKKILLSHSATYNDELNKEINKKKKTTKNVMKKIQAEQKQSTLGDLDELSALKNDLENQ